MNISDKLKLINTLKIRIDSQAPQKDWDQAFLTKVKVDFTYNSNKIEGNTITYGQTIKLLKDLVTPSNATTGEFLDIINHHRVLDIVFNNYRSQKISEDNIKELHKELMKDIDQWSDDGLYSPGLYKVFDNMTVRSNGKIYTYLPPNQVSHSMATLILTINEMLKNVDINDTENHPLSIATYFHQKFLNEIHPFSDGNGRIGRIFTNLILLKNGYPPVFITEVDKQEYLKCFELAETDEYAMLNFMADRLVESLESKLEFIEASQQKPFPI